MATLMEFLNRHLDIDDNDDIGDDDNKEGDDTVLLD